MNKDTFCILPFIGMNVHLDGGLAPCCMQDHNDISHRFDEWEHWRDQGLRQLKSDLLAGVRNPRCYRCWDHEDLGVASYRQRHNDKFRQHPIFQSGADPWKNYDLEFLHLDFDSFCNLKCIMCHPTVSSSLAAEYQANPERWQEFFGHVKLEKNKWHESEKFDRFVEQIRNIKTLILTGGEPLINPRVIELLRALPLEQINLIVTTNATIIKPEVLALLSRSKRLGVTVSLEGIGAHNDYLRYGSSWPDIDANIKKIAELQNCPVVVINHVLQHTSIYALPAVVEYALINQHEININKLTFPPWLSIAGVSPNQRQELIENLQDQLSRVELAKFPKSFESWLQSALQIVQNTEYDPALKDKFDRYVSTLDTTRGTSFTKTFLN